MKITHLLIAGLLLASCSSNSQSGASGKWPTQPALPVVSGEATFNVDANTHYVNVMGNTIPRMPKFPSVSVKPGYARGYVADLSGKPLKGAHVGVSSSLVGGWYSSGTATTDANGYYEFKIPAGAAYFFGTATTINYGEGTAVVALYPAGGATSFPSGSGVVKNFVLLSYGPARPEDVAQQPYNESNYYGGSLSLNYSLNYEGENVPNYIPLGGVVEIELIPDGPGLYGENKTFKISKTIGNVLAFNIVNIPVGKYTVKARMKNGRDLLMSASGPQANVYPHLGLKPDNAVGTTTVLFTPNYQFTPDKVASFKSNWKSLSIRIQRQ